MKLIDVFLALSVTIVWGTNYVAIRVGLHEFPPFLLMAIRFFFVAILLSPWLRMIKREQWRPLLGIAAIFGGAYFSLLFIGMLGVSAGEGAIITSVQVPIAALFAYFMFREKLTWLTILGIIVSIVGVIISVGMPQHHSGYQYVVLVFIAAVIWAYSNNLMRRLGHIHPLAFNGAIALITLPFYTLYAFWRHPNALEHFRAANWQGYAALAYIVIVAMIYGYGMWFFLLSRNPINRVVPFVLLIAPSGLIAGHFLLNESIYMHTVIGTIICILGLAFVVIKREKKRRS